MLEVNFCQFEMAFQGYSIIYVTARPDMQHKVSPWSHHFYSIIFNKTILSETASFEKLLGESFIHHCSLRKQLRCQRGSELERTFPQPERKEDVQVLILIHHI
uniref:Ovule protein n=1 Tax=Elaeophora elaphi TaxID=1147741 RepID=A0A0R3RHH3_9BILA